MEELAVLRINAECLMKCHVELGVFESEIRIGAMMRRDRAAAELIIGHLCQSSAFQIVLATYIIIILLQLIERYHLIGI